MAQPACQRARVIMWISAVGFVTLTSATAAAQLLNGGFEGNGGSLDGWITFNNPIENISAQSITPHSGTHVAKVFGAYTENPNYCGLFQNLPAAPGQIWAAACYARHNSNDALTGTSNQVVMKIEFYRVAGGVHGTDDFLGEVSVVILDSSSPLDSWTPYTLQAPAPAETVEARLAFVFTQHDWAGGAALIDDAELTSDEPTPPQWSLIWSDEFDGTEVDATKWRVEDLHLIKNNELQYYAPDDVYVEDGCLILRSQERFYCGYDSNGQWGCYDYTSGLVESIDRFALAYGRVESRARLPGTQGIWPAHWMLPTSGTWPPEIDIMELLGHEPTRVYMTHHWGAWPNVQSDGGSYSGPDFSQDFHTFGVEWTPERIDWFVDGLLRFSSTQSIPREPFYVILNTAVGGDWPGNPDGSTVFPQYHQIDYVRVYVPADPGDPLLEFVDGTSASATADGVIDPGEYAYSTTGINDGFGDRIGLNSLLWVDSSADGRINFGFDSVNPWPTTGPLGVVIYVDSVAGGYASTVELNDTADLGRRLASGEGMGGGGSDLYFAQGFRADYAICLAPDFAGIYQLDRAGHMLVNGADLGASTDVFGGHEVSYQSDGGLADWTIRELEAQLGHIGAGQSNSVRFVVTTLHGDNGYRANEFVGVAPGNDWDTDNPGHTDAVLKSGDFIQFRSAPMRGDFDGNGIVDFDDFYVFQDCMSGPAATPAPTPPLDSWECLNAFDFDEDSDNDLADFGAFQSGASGFVDP